MERRYSEELQQMWADAKRDGVVTPEEAAAIQTRMQLEDEQRNAPPPPPGAWEQALPLLTIAGGTAAAGGIGKWLVEQATQEGVKDVAEQVTTQAGQQLAGQAGSGAASAATAGSAGQAPAMPALVSALQGGAPTAAAPSAFGGGTGLLSAGWAAPAAAVGAYYAPSAIEHGGEILSAAADGDLSAVDTDSGVKGALLTNPVTAWAVPIADALGISIKSGKDRDQQVRDNLRGHLQDIGFLDENWNADIGDGRFYNFGSEELRAGHTDPTQVGEEITGTPQNQSFNIDWKSYAQNPQNESVLGGMNALMMALSSGQTDRWQDLTGNAYNAAIHGGNDAEATVDQFYQSADEKGFGWGQQKESIRQAWADGRITAPERDAAFAEIDKRYGVVNETGERWDQQTLMSEEERRRNEEELAMGYIPR